jgi:hypothetical protein
VIFCASSIEIVPASSVYCFSAFLYLSITFFVLGLAIFCDTSFPNSSSLSITLLRFTLAPLSPASCAIQL